MIDDLKLRAAELLLQEAIQELGRSVHTGGIEGGRSGDGGKGIELADRIAKHCDQINSALDYWENSLRYYNSVAATVGQQGLKQ